jgi:hypothetical protein
MRTMNLHNATTLLLFGLAYTVIHKAVLALLPAHEMVGLAAHIASILWIVATASIIVFAYTFLREVRPLSPRIRLSLLAVMTCTGIIALERLLFTLSLVPVRYERILSGAPRLLNAVALLVFLVSFDRLLGDTAPLKMPVRMTAAGLVLSVILGLLSTGYYVSFLLTGNTVVPWGRIQPLSVVVFLFTYGSAIWFLRSFGRIPDFSTLTNPDAPRD